MPDMLKHLGKSMENFAHFSKVYANLLNTYDFFQVLPTSRVPFQLSTNWNTVISLAFLFFLSKSLNSRLKG